MTAAEADWAAAVRLLSSYDEVALVCHVGPDGDALGSMLALGLALRTRGCKVRASWGSEPFEVPAAYATLPGLDLLVPADEIPDTPGLLVTFDTGNTDRLGSLADRVEAATDVLVIDHPVALGGGGHRFAAGFTTSDDVDTTLVCLRKALATAPHLPE